MFYIMFQVLIEGMPVKSYKIQLPVFLFVAVLYQF